MTISQPTDFEKAYCIAVVEKAKEFTIVFYQVCVERFLEGEFAFLFFFFGFGLLMNFVLSFHQFSLDPMAGFGFDSASRSRPSSNDNATAAAGAAAAAAAAADDTLYPVIDNVLSKPGGLLKMRTLSVVDL